MIRPFNPRLRIKTDSLAALAVTLAPIFYFLPAIRNHLVLGPDDGVIFNVPLRVAAAQIVRSGNLPLWNPFIFSGMPLLAAAQGGLLFPLNWFYLFFSPSVATDLMVISAYMLAALGAYLYSRRTGASISGAIVTSLIWQGGGFLIGQISHINIVHTAAMLPWVLWALERYLSDGRRSRGVVLAALVALQAFAGHQQALAYSLILVAAYAIVMSFADRPNRKRYLSALAFTTAGLLLAAVQIVPTFELLRNSPRVSATYDFFSSFSMPRRFVSTFFAPYVMGGGDGRLFRAPYIGQAYYSEYVAYAGVLAIMLVLLALLIKPDTRTKFWAVAGLVCLVLALGSGAPLYLYRVIYYVPVLNLFRVPARHLMEVSFAIAVLAGRGLTSLSAIRGSKEAKRRAAIAAGAVFLFTLLVVTWWRPANFHLRRQAPVSILRAPELFLPILFAAASAWALWSFARRRQGRTLVLLAILAIDLVAWGQSSGWYTASLRTDNEYWRTPETVRMLRAAAPADSASYRILTAPHSFDPAVAPVAPSVSHSPEWTLWTQPDLYMMHGIQNAAGYDGFGLERYSQLAGRMKVWGELTDPDATLRGNSREVDLLNVRYLLSMREQAGKAAGGSTGSAAIANNADAFPPAPEQFGGFAFAQADLGLPNVTGTKRLSFTVPAIEIDQVALLTNLSWSENVPDKTIIGRLRLKTKDGRTIEFPLAAGFDSAEWAYDRPDIRARIRHRRATVAASYDVADIRGSYQGHNYLSSFGLPDKAVITAGEIVVEPDKRWPDLSLGVFRVSLVNAAAAKTYPLRRDWVNVENLSNLVQRDAAIEKPLSERWKLVSQTDAVDIYENARAMPRAWLVSEARTLDDQAMLEVIRTGRLPDGSEWKPLQTALVEAEIGAQFTPGATARAQVTRYEPSRVEVKSTSDVPSILILSENHYPGWLAYVDGHRVDVLRVNYALRGVVLPAGEHEVQFVYRPKSVLFGALISLLTLAGLLMWMVRGRYSDRSARKNS